MSSDTTPRFPLPPAFAPFQNRCRAAAASRPDMPTDLVVLSRLYGYVAMKMEAAFDRLMAPWELNSWSWLALMMVYSRQDHDVTPTDVSRALFLARANVTRVTDDLVRRGLLHREPSTRDRRVLCLSLTEAGQALIQEIMPHAWDTHRAIWSCLDPEQLAGAQDLLSGIAMGIESRLEALPPGSSKEPA